MSKFTYQRYINETDLDVFGHVNHANYLKIYEESRWAWLKEKDVDLHTIRSRGEGLVILNVAIAYKKEITSGETITITAQVDSFEGKIVTISQKMINEAGLVCSTLSLTIALFDLKARKIMPPNDFWKQVFEIN